MNYLYIIACTGLLLAFIGLPVFYARWQWQRLTRCMDQYLPALEDNMEDPIERAVFMGRLGNAINKDNNPVSARRIIMDAVRRHENRSE